MFLFLHRIFCMRGFALLISYSMDCKLICPVRSPINILQCFLSSLFMNCTYLSVDPSRHSWLVPYFSQTFHSHRFLFSIQLLILDFCSHLHNRMLQCNLQVAVFIAQKFFMVSTSDYETHDVCGSWQVNLRGKMMHTCITVSNYCFHDLLFLLWCNDGWPPTTLPACYHMFGCKPIHNLVDCRVQHSIMITKFLFKQLTSLFKWFLFKK